MSTVTKIAIFFRILTNEIKIFDLVQKCELPLSDKKAWQENLESRSNEV